MAGGEQPVGVGRTAVGAEQQDAALIRIQNQQAELMQWQFFAGSAAEDHTTGHEPVACPGPGDPALQEGDELRTCPDRRRGLAGPGKDAAAPVPAAERGHG